MDGDTVMVHYDKAQIPDHVDNKFRLDPTNTQVEHHRGKEQPPRRAKGGSLDTEGSRKYHALDEYPFFSSATGQPPHTGLVDGMESGGKSAGILHPDSD